MTKGWHLIETDAGVTLCRHLPPRFDFAATAELPLVSPKRLAHQIRQDLWRALQRLRGFSPVVQLVRADAGWSVTAGGRAARPIPALATERARMVLTSPAHQARWTRHAGRIP